jgi:Icc-related predicted phosphoesterase
MRIQYCSDLHLEFIKNKNFLNSNKLIPKADVLILAGDVIPLSKNLEDEKYFDFLSNSFKEIFWLLGNHEYYHSDIVQGNSFKKMKVRHNIHILNNDIISLDDSNLIFSTLWSKISPSNELYIKSHLSDFSLIRIEDEAFRPKHYNELHKQSVKFIEDSLKTFEGKRNTVITHHVPTLLNYPVEYRNSPLNEAFSVELYNLIEKHQPEAWIYGHSHINTPEFRIGKTRMLTNQLGYKDMDECNDFKCDLVVEV